MKRLALILGAVMVLGVTAHANADPGPGDEVVITVGNCDDGTTVVSAHNTQEISLGYIIRIDGILVEQGRLAPGDRVSRTYDVPLGESHFYRIRLGLPVDHTYFSDEGTTDRTNCPTPPPSTTPPPTTIPPPTTTPPPTTSTTTTPPPTTHTTTTSPPCVDCHRRTADTGLSTWLIWTLGILLVVGTGATIVARRKSA